MEEIINKAEFAQQYLGKSSEDFDKKLAGCPVGGSANTYCFGIDVFNNTSPVTTVNEYGYGATLDTTQLTYTNCRVFIYIPGNVTVNNVIYYRTWQIGKKDFV